MKRFINFVKSYIVVILLYLVLVLGVAYVSVSSILKRQNKNYDVVAKENTEIIAKIQEKIEDAQVQSEITRAVVKAEKEEDKKDLEIIATIDDGVERRKRLAEKLASIK